MVIPKSKFQSKFPISKWSFVNFGLFKSSKLTKYILKGLSKFLKTSRPFKHPLVSIYINSSKIQKLTTCYANY